MFMLKCLQACSRRVQWVGILSVNVPQRLLLSRGCVFARGGYLFHSGTQGHGLRGRGHATVMPNAWANGTANAAEEYISRWKWAKPRVAFPLHLISPAALISHSARRRRRRGGLCPRGAAPANTLASGICLTVDFFLQSFRFRFRLFGVWLRNPCR